MKHSEVKEEGLYLCKVKGLKFLDYAILKFSDGEWWQYAKEYIAKIEGWIGVRGDIEIVDVIQKIE